MSKLKRSQGHQAFTKGGRGRLPSDVLLDRPTITKRDSKPLEARTKTQAAFINAISVYDIIFAEGPFGTGKTHVAAYMGADALATGEIDRLLITRPAVNADEEYGFLPGEMLDDAGGKFAPYFAPVRNILEKRLGAGTVEYYLKAGKIEIAPLGHLRGHTFEDAWVIFDEAQNCTPKQMKLFLSRIGERAKLIIDGDLDQKDIPGPSGFEDGMHRLRGHGQVGHVKFTTDDIVRSGLARDICIAYQGNSEIHDFRSRLERSNRLS